ncbi:cytochrome c [Ochrobactrum sp. BTU2]|uniref:cytochrome c n=1 Tax=Ochrobactrum sp. BTU2 TaxID=2856166 RepID=UPI00211A2B51|nr:cytochrome c [Ochrobactrum sp. BTU2]
MKEMAKAGKTIAGMFEGKIPYSASDFKQAAETIKTRSGDALIKEFPAMSLGPPSAAKTEIELSHDEFDALARKVAEFGRCFRIGGQGTGRNIAGHADGRFGVHYGQQSSLETQGRSGRKTRHQQDSGRACLSSHDAGMLGLSHQISGKGPVTVGICRQRQ